MWNTVRIFISSTFKDMDVERDALKNIVLPQLNHYFAPMRYQIEMVDLRHSIETDKEESAEQREKIIFNICMDEIESCKPFFLGLVGHRYGWIPDKQQMLPPSIYDTLPDDFPIGRQHLSVTVFEFLNGIFNPQANFDRTNTLVLLRDAASYEGIGETRLRDYVDTGDNRRYVGLLRDYLATHRHDYRLTRYTLKLQQATSEHVLRWSEAVCQQLQRQLSAYINARQEATTETLRQEEAYVNGMTRHFAGREADISALMDILHTRHVAHVNQHEDGLGQSALLCRLYELLRHDPERLCLFHAVEAYPDGNDFSIVLYDWCWLMCRELGEGWEALEERKGNLSQLDKLFQQLMERIRVERHKTVTICLDDPQRARGSLRLRYAFVDVVLTERMPAEYDRDMGNYVLKPLTPADRALVARDLRSRPKKALLEKANSGNVKWLTLATAIANSLNRLDYLEIRNHDDGDQEDSIDDYLIRLIAGMPDDYTALQDYWITRLEDILGKETVSRYLFLVGLCNGLTDEDLGQLMGKRLMEVVLIRQTIGRDIVREEGKGSYVLPREMKRRYQTMIRTTDTDELRRINGYVLSLPHEGSTWQQNALLTSLVALNRETVVALLSEPDLMYDGSKPSLAFRGLSSLIACNAQLFHDCLAYLLKETDPDVALYNGLVKWLDVAAANNEQEIIVSLCHIIFERLYDEAMASDIDNQLGLSLVRVINRMNGAVVLIDDAERGHAWWLKWIGQELALARRYYQNTDAWNKMMFALLLDKEQGIPMNKPKERWDFLNDSFLPMLNQQFDFVEDKELANLGMLLADVAILGARYEQEFNTGDFATLTLSVFRSVYEKSVGTIDEQFALGQWMEHALYMLQLRYHLDDKQWGEVFSGVLQVYDVAIDQLEKELLTDRNKALLAHLISDITFLIAPADAQKAMGIADHFFVLLLRRVYDTEVTRKLSEDSMAAARHGAYIHVCDDLCRHVGNVNGEVSLGDVTYAWGYMARLRIILAFGRKGELTSLFPIEPSREIRTLGSLQELRNGNIWERALDVCFLLTEFHFLLLQVQRSNGYPYPQHAKQLLEGLELWWNEGQVLYRNYDVSIASWMEQLKKEVGEL